MKIPHLGLFGRFLVLFAVTTVLFSLFVLLGSFATTEQEAKQFVNEREPQLFEMIQQIAQRPIDEVKLNSDAKSNRVRILVERGEQRFVTSGEFPSIDELAKNAEPIGHLYFSKLNSQYYLYANTSDTNVVVTSRLVNLIVYPQWLILWPWIAALLVLMTSYYILKRLLDPINTAIESANRISQGDFHYRIASHPKSELSRLTQSLNKMAADLQRLFESKNEMLLAISHELRTPLGRMNVSLAMLEQNEITKELSSDIHYMNNLIGQLLEGERLQQGPRVLSTSTYYLPTLIEDVLNENGLRDRVTIMAPLPEEAIKLDVGRIKFVLRNLLQNAIEHGKTQQNVELAVNISENAVSFSVIDHGLGIPEHMLENMFTPFFHAENINHRSTDGVGLALFLCKRIAQAHNGELTVANLNPKGCEFKMSLPVQCIVT
ncbi:HAMP domain-containing histidine kinase (plasmid) [Pseudoalteromonas xiamenensis]|uniref:sensor histidine kinase n=1 Tax=Pseudoalteromonas xiamenensis TaxID=882626 RepID=UPI0027E4DD52|nr:HAMP domain-containing sensor histidine kinase [Pseudoalteromonas xiamenensis]WMN61758.1 HAMP domain-containing histidine kinase [Pseudoalteromonas xiamenensis]